MIVETTHADTTGTGVAVDHQLHHRGRFLKLPIVQLGVREDAENVHVLADIQGGRVAVAVGDICRFHITTTQQVAQVVAAVGIGKTTVDAVDAFVADAGDGFHYRHGIGLVEQADQFAGVYQAGHIGAPVYLGGTG